MKKASSSKTLKKPAAALKKQPESKSTSKKKSKRPAAALKEQPKSKSRHTKVQQQVVMSDAEIKFWKDRNIDPSQIEPGSAALQIDLSEKAPTENANMSPISLMPLTHT